MKNCGVEHAPDQVKNPPVHVRRGFLTPEIPRPQAANARGAFTPGDPDASGPAILKVVDAAEPPLRIFFGTVGLPMTRAEYERRLSTWEAWNDVSVEAQGTLPIGS